MEYCEEDFIQLSGIQHFVFCRRQWGLIHVEQAWDENFLTADGRLMHDRTHDPFIKEKRKNVIISRAMPIVSRRLGVTGECDVVEFIKDADGISLNGYEGKYKVALSNTSEALQNLTIPTGCSLRLRLCVLKR